MKVNASGFSSRNPTSVTSFRLYFPQSAMDGKLLTYHGQSANTWCRVCRVASSQWGHAVGSSGKNLVRYSPVGA